MIYNNKKKINIIICGGGTGGHIYPAITIADTIKKKLNKNNILYNFLFIGGLNNMEMKIVPINGYKITGLWISGIPKCISRNFFIFPFKIFNSYIKCKKIIKYFNPDIVIGTGGYVSAIPLYIANKMNIPTFIQEQNVKPGYTNLVLGNRYAKKIFVAYKETSLFFPIGKTIITGNPIRNKILLNNNNNNRKEIYKKFNLDSKKLTILSIGGSQGARNINNSWRLNIKKIIKENIQLLWQVGNLDFKEILNDVNCKHPNIVIYNFIDKIHMAYNIADIIVSRAGGLALSEISVLGKPSILIPITKSSNNHQYENSKFFKKKNAAIIINDKEAKEKLVDTSIFLIKNKNLKKELSKNILSINKLNASKNITNEILKYIL